MSKQLSEFVKITTENFLKEHGYIVFRSQVELIVEETVKNAIYTIEQAFSSKPNMMYDGKQVVSNIKHLLT